MTDPKVIEALDALRNAISPQLTESARQDQRERAAVAIAALSAPPSAPETPAPAPDDLPSVWVDPAAANMLAKSTLGFARAWAAPAPLAEAVEYVPRAQLAARVAALPATATRDDVLAIVRGTR